MTGATRGQALPAVRRARDFHLYTADGRRLLDLYLDDGAALLGHRPERLGRELKNVLDRGLLGNLPSSHASRLVRVLRRLLPGHRWFGIAVGADAAWRLLQARMVGLPATPAGAADPLRDPDWQQAPVAWWRPLCDRQPFDGVWSSDGPAALLHRLPFGIGAGPVTVSTRNPGEPEAAPAHASGSLGASVSPLLLAGAATALNRLQRAAPQRLRSAAQWPRRMPGWRRDGIYLSAEFSPRDHRRVYAACLAAGVLLNPRYPGPAILPATVSRGERQLLERLFRELFA